MQILMKKEDALKTFRSPSGIAKAIGVTKQAVSQWGDTVPEASALKLLRVNPSIPHTETKQATA